MAPDVVTRPIQSLLPSREHDVIYGPTSETDPDIVVLAEAIKLSGHYQLPVATDDTPNTPPGTLVSGYRVLVALRSLGRAEVQVILRGFESEAHFRQAIVLLNQHRIKSKWTMVMEVKVMTESFRPASKERQRKAGGPRRTPSAVSGLPSVPPVDSDSEAVDEIDLIEEVDLASTLSPLSAAVAGSGAILEDASAMAQGIDHVTQATQVDATSESEESPPGDTARTRTRTNRGGETLKLVARALQLGTDTTRLCGLLYGEAARQNSDDPGASEVATKLRKPGAKFETVAREFALIEGKVTPSASVSSVSDPLSDLDAVAKAMRRLVTALMPPTTQQPPTALEPTLRMALRGAVDASVALLAATSDPSLRLVHLCPREGVDLPPLHDAQMMVSEARLRDAIKDALMADWPVEAIAVEAKLSGTVKHEEVAAWCQGQSVGLGHDDLCRLARWVERNHGRPNPSKAVRS